MPDPAPGDATRTRIRELVADGAASLQQLADRLGIRMQSVDHHVRHMPDADDLRKAMAAKWARQFRHLEAYGESKTLAGWAKDPRCVVSRNTVRARLADGWSLEDALSTPARRRGQTPALTDAEAAALKAAADLVHSLPRVHRGTPADAPERVATRARDELMRQAERRADIAEIGRATGLSYGSAWRHVRGDRSGNTSAPMQPCAVQRDAVD
jgi:hypothetical protein